jgi:hypothetical protein
MNVGRVIGAIITTIAGIFVLIFNFAIVDLRSLSFGDGSALAWIINLIIAILALVGGIMGLTSKTGGTRAYPILFGRRTQILAVNSLIALAAGIISILLGIFGKIITQISTILAQYSLVSYLWRIGPWFGITLEAILMLLGGIIMQIAWERKMQI